MRTYLTSACQSMRSTVAPAASSCASRKGGASCTQLVLFVVGCVQKLRERLKEAAGLGFKRAIIPAANKPRRPVEAERLQNALAEMSGVGN